MTTHNLQEKAMLASISITMWSARKLDKRVTAETNQAHNADADAGRYNKALLSTNALSDLVAIANRARAELYARTLPWADSGTRILSAVGYDGFTTAMRGLQGEFFAARDAFVGNYPAFVDAARVRLNGMFDAADYPDAGEIAAKFTFGRRIWPMPASDDFRVSIGDADRDRIRAEIAADLESTIGEAINDVFARVADTVGAMADKLAAFKPAAGKGDTSSGVFRDSLVGNVRSLVDMLPSLNVTGDPRVAAIASSMQALAYHDADDLRADAALRADIAKQARAIKATVDDYMA